MKPVLDTPADKWEIDRNSIELGPKLGSGQYGEVYKGKWEQSPGVFVTIAVKTLKGDSASQSEFMKETTLMKKMKHENLLNLLGVCTLQKPFFMITQFMPHGSLLDYLRKYKDQIDSEFFLLAASQIAAGMSYLEAESMVHRDLACRNCLVDENLMIRICDFGLSRLLGEEDSYTAPANHPVNHPSNHPSANHPSNHPAANHPVNHPSNHPAVNHRPRFQNTSHPKNYPAMPVIPNYPAAQKVAHPPHFSPSHHPIRAPVNLPGPVKSLPQPLTPTKPRSTSECSSRQSSEYSGSSPSAGGNGGNSGGGVDLLSELKSRQSKRNRNTEPQMNNNNNNFCAVNPVKHSGVAGSVGAASCAASCAEPTSSPRFGRSAGKPADTPHYHGNHGNTGGNHGNQSPAPPPAAPGNVLVSLYGNHGNCHAPTREG
eukprot:sb/3464943/